MNSASKNVPVDPRGVCNLILDEVARLGQTASNLKLQKLLYFAHGFHLLKAKRPLVYGYFEAWELGPVHPAAYMAFKRAGDRPITFRAERTDPLTGATSPLANPDDPAVFDSIARVVLAYGRASAGRLVELSHVKDAPWHYIVSKARNTGLAFGLRIPDNVIEARFRHHMMFVDPQSKVGDHGEDTPFTGFGPGAHRSVAD